MRTTEEIIKELDMRYPKGDNRHLGSNMNILANKINASRVEMHANHERQDEISRNSEPPLFGTANDNIIGMNSDCYTMVKDRVKVVYKFIKYKDHPNMHYFLLVQDSNGVYDIIERKEVEDLTEKYGFEYNNDVIDNLNVNDIIEPNTIVSRAVNIDENGNYLTGRNAYVLYICSTDSIEDSLGMREGFAKDFDSSKVTTVRVTVNSNDVMLNYYGDNDTYQGIPEIGQSIKEAIICATRRIDTKTYSYSMRKDKLRSLSGSDTTIYYLQAKDEDTKVVDINVYCNRKLEDIEDKVYNNQLKKLYKESLEFRTEICQVLGDIRDRGSEYTRNFAKLLNESEQFINANNMWSYNKSGSKFDGFVVDITIRKEDHVDEGYKFTGRYGNKGVVGRLIPDDEMFYFYKPNGEKVMIDLIIDELGKCGRINASQEDEITTNYIIRDVIWRHIAPEKDINKKIEILCDLISDLVPEFLDTLKDVIEHTDKVEFFNYIEENSLKIIVDPFYNNLNLDVYQKVINKYGVKKTDVYVKRFGREIKLENALVTGQEYILKLKHTPEEKASFRGLGGIDSKDLPNQSNERKENKVLFSAAAIKPGEYGFQNMAICNDYDAVYKFNMINNSSFDARRRVATVLEEDDVLETGMYVTGVKDIDTNRNAEILQIKNLALGLIQKKRDVETGEVYNTYFK